MESDCYQHVRKCVKYQTYADHINLGPSTLHNLTSLWLFSMWGIYVIGPIEPKASNRHRFILVAIDYFTKWVKVASYSNITRSVAIGMTCYPTHYTDIIPQYEPPQGQPPTH
ncbi:hypothetical protein CR513_14759, partial [Mucuna pruriens]